MRRTALAIVVITLVGITVLAHHISTLDQPAYLATAIMADGRDVNLQMNGDGSVRSIAAARYDQQGHATLPAFEGSILGLKEVPGSPVLGWSFAPAEQIASGEVAPRVCFAERAAFDRTAPEGRSFTEASARRVMDEFVRKFAVQPYVEDCTRPHFVFGSNAQSDCGNGAYGCAALRNGNRTYLDRHIRITVNGDAVRSGAMHEGAALSTDGHEIGHAFDRDHTQGTTAQHGHCTSMTAIYAPDGPAVGRDDQAKCPRGEFISVEDYDDEHLGLKLRVEQPNPSANYLMKRFVLRDGQFVIEEVHEMKLSKGDEHAIGIVALTPSGEVLHGPWHFIEVSE